MGHHLGCSSQAHPTWTVASKDRHLSMVGGRAQPDIIRSLCASRVLGLQPVSRPTIFDPTHLLLLTRLWHKLVAPGNRVGLGFQGQYCPCLKNLEAGLDAKKGG